MTLNELREKAITESLKRNNGNAELAANDLKITSRTVYSFKAEQKIKNDLLTTSCEKLKPSKQ